MTDRKKLIRTLLALTFITILGCGSDSSSTPTSEETSETEKANSELTVNGSLEGLVFSLTWNEPLSDEVGAISNVDLEIITPSGKISNVHQAADACFHDGDNAGEAGWGIEHILCVDPVPGTYEIIARYVGGNKEAKLNMSYVVQVQVEDDFLFPMKEVNPGTIGPNIGEIRFAFTLKQGSGI